MVNRSFRFIGVRKPLQAVATALGMCMLLAVPAVNAQEYTVNLKDTDIQELIKFVAEVTDTTIIVDPQVKGKVKVVSSKPIKTTELYSLFLSILDVHGYTAVRSGDVIRIVQNKDARSSPVAVTDPSQNDSTPAGEYVTQVIRLENISAAKLIPVLRPLVPQQAHMAAYTPSNAIVISDLASNISRINDLISQMDQSAIQETDILPLEYAVAEDVVKMLEQLNKSEAAQAGGEETVLLVADTRTNSVLVTGDELQRARMRALVEHLDTPLQRAGNVKVVYLKYAKAADVAQVLTKVMQNIGRLDSSKSKTSGGHDATIEADEGTNSLIITADTDEMAALESVIYQLDIRRAQVLVEAIIVEMEVIDGQSLGLQWLFANDSGVYGSSVSSDVSTAGAISSAVLGGNADAANPVGDFDLGQLAAALAGSPGLTLGWGAIDNDLSMTVILNALKKQSNANILSTPTLLTLDNQEAYITVGQNVPFVTGAYTNTGSGGSGVQNPFQTIERENVGITLTVTPHINDGDSVVLDIEQEVSSLTGLSSIASDLITNERKIQTKVLAGDGKTVVLGGLIKDNVQDGSQRVPVLGSIPLLGRLFRNDAVEVTKTNLLIFIRPTIIRDDRALDNATAGKYKFIREQQLQRRAKGSNLLDAERMPVLPEWQRDIQALDAMQEQQ
ncbi:General secretion pathway protein D [Aequoribacter fuscus]|uniref:General secretion pathway protein D n=1 Tax=Aequoribacter fuscus TaxID=2518989 RepID=F3L1F7_9GAMM|nr:type II secretion system secretin GspD [Aequoribacter fuscus]EGG29849.1 General secretion pathway protein D [Aequoribacter fuscus]QHJ88699.1 type II secretion system protein GspD [Aequoribacter fuscus]